MLTYSRNGKTYEIDPMTLKPEAHEYLLQYGFAQSLQDSIAGLEKRVTIELWENACKKVGAELPMNFLDCKPEQKDVWQKANEIANAEKDSISAAIDGQLNKRLDAIVAGTIGVRSIGEARDPLKAVANGMIRKALARKKLKADKDKFAQLVSDLLATDRAKVQAEYDRQCLEADALDVEVEV